MLFRSEVGAEVKVVGRIQSRTYEKKHEDGTVEQKVAYEVSISNLEVINENSKGEVEDKLDAENKEEVAEKAEQVSDSTSNNE